MQNLIIKLGYKFNDINLLKTALTHSSYANENKSVSYERLEFLGDSILSFVISTYLYKNFSHLPEGALSKMRAAIVCERSLEDRAKELSIGEHLILSKGEELTGGRNRPSILADVFEAILAAIYLDGGFDKAQEFAMQQFGDAINEVYDGKGIFRDYKTTLQEIVQNNDQSVEYVHVKEEGPEHNKKFTVEVIYMGNTLSCGSGRSKKEAEQNAAKEAIKKVSNEI